MRSILSLLLIAFILVVCMGSARADDDKKDGNRAKAGEYFARGERLFDSGAYAKAAAAFLLAYELAPHPMVLANIAMSYDKAGIVVKAIEYYEKYFAGLKKKKERTKIKARLKELSSMVGELSVECPAAGCRIEVDKIDRGEAPVRIVVEIGLHRVEAFDGKNKIAAVDARVVSGEVSKVELFQRDVIPKEPEKEEEEEPVDQPVEEVPVEPVLEEEGATLGAGFWVSAGATVAAGAVTVVFGIRTKNDKEEFDATGGTDKDLKEQGEQDQLITNIMIGVTSAAAACAVGFLIYDLKSGDSEKEEPVALVPGPGGLGLAVVGRF